MANTTKRQTYTVPNTTSCQTLRSGQHYLVPTLSTANTTQCPALALVPITPQCEHYRRPTLPSAQHSPSAHHSPVPTLTSGNTTVNLQSPCRFHSRICAFVAAELRVRVPASLHACAPACPHAACVPVFLRACFSACQAVWLLGAHLRVCRPPAPLCLHACELVYLCARLYLCMRSCACQRPPACASFVCAPVADLNSLKRRFLLFFCSAASIFRTCTRAYIAFSLVLPFFCFLC